MSGGVLVLSSEDQLLNFKSCNSEFDFEDIRNGPLSRAIEVMKLEDGQNIINALEHTRNDFSKSSSKVVDDRILNRFEANTRLLSNKELDRQIALFRSSSSKGRPPFVFHNPIEDRKETFMVIMFVRPAKAKEAFFEGMIFEKVASEIANPTDYPSDALPIRVIECSSGLQSRMMFGIFAEYFNEGGKNQLGKGVPAFYLVDRFGDRFFEITLPAIIKGMTENSFPHIRKKFATFQPEDRVVSDEWKLDLENAAAIWLTRHEFFHNDTAGTSLPYNGYLKAKGSRITGGLEELRVDLNSIADCLNSNLSDWIHEYIFAERLLAYSLVDLVQFNPWPSFDSIGSHYLLSCLLELGHVKLNGGQMDLCPINTSMILEVIDLIRDLENQALANVRKLKSNRCFVESSDFEQYQIDTVIRSTLEQGVLRQIGRIDLPKIELKSGYLMPAIYQKMSA